MEACIAGNSHDSLEGHSKCCYQEMNKTAPEWDYGQHVVEVREGGAQ